MKNAAGDKSIPRSLIIAFAVVVAIAALVIGSLIFIRNRQSSMKFRSRYTYVNELALHSTDEMSLEDEARSWFERFIGQHTGTLVPSDVRLKSLSIDDISVIDEESGIVRIYFSAVPASEDHEYFSDWTPRYINGRMYCDWAVKLGIKTTENNKDGIYVISVADNSSYVPDDGNEDPTVPSDNDDGLAEYRIRSSTLEVSFDGGYDFESVPVDLKNLMLSDNDTSVLQPGSYSLSRDIAAFVTGGATINGEKVPVSVIYSSDRGDDWVTTQVDQIFDVSYTYMKMFDDENGVLVLAYARAGEQEFSKIYKTSDGCETWDPVGNGPEDYTLKGVFYPDEDTAFFVYNYGEGIKDTLRVSHDGGKTFTSAQLPAGELDESAGDQKWENIYKEATVPVADSEGKITVYLVQTGDSSYLGGQTAAKYESTDNGTTWKYVEQV